MENLTRHYLISGRVQGVGFRAFTERSAQEIELNGWVRNLKDGRVEAWAQGNSEQLALFEVKLKSGPRHSRVDSVTVKEVPEAESLSGFHVRADGTLAST